MSSAAYLCNMAKQLCILTIMVISSVLVVKAQDMFPSFSVVNRGNDHIIISWTNPYLDTIRQLSIQRSYDSVKGFKSVLTLPDPTVLQNGYVDTQAPSPRMFYRLYILLDNGRYVFSKSRRPVLDTTKVITTTALIQKDPVTVSKPVNALPAKAGTETFIPSRYVFTDKYGNVKVALPDAASKNYHIKFLDENGTVVFELDKINDTMLTLDKTNFIRSGWFRFDLYDGEELKENYKFFLPKDF